MISVDSARWSSGISSAAVVTGRGDWKGKLLTDPGRAAYNFAKSEVHEGLQYVHNKYKNEKSFEKNVSLTH